MILQLSIWAPIVGIIVALIIVIVFLYKRGQTPVAPAPAREAGVYTPGEQEILRQLGDMRERLEKFIPPFAHTGYVPGSASELAQLLGFSYIRVGDQEYGSLPEGFDKYLETDAELAQLKISDKYIYIIKKDSKKLVAIGDTYLDYLTIMFLRNFLDYIS